MSYFFVLTSLVFAVFIALIWHEELFLVVERDLNVSFRITLLTFAVLYICTLAVGFWLVMSLIIPLRQTLLKAKTIASKKFRKSLSEQYDDLVKIEDLGEFSDLEEQLNSIYEKLKRKNVKIAREKEELKAVTHSMSDSMVVTDLAGRIVFCNPKFQGSFLEREIRKGEKVLSDVIAHVELLEAFQTVIQSCEVVTCEAKLPIMHFEESRIYSVTVSPLYERKDGGPVYGAVGIFHDITEARSLQQMRMEFVTNASHELRTPLTTLKGYIEALRDDQNAGRFEDSERFINVIAANVDRLTELTNDLLQISKLETGNLKMNMEWVRVDEIETSIREQVESLRAKKQATLNFLSDLDWVFVDRLRFEQVLINLVTNAFKYTGGPGLVSVHLVADRDDEFRVDVQDSGPGIESHHLPRLFERFYRTDPSRNRSEGGTGLGLAIVKHIVQAHGGDVGVSSEVGKGTCFRCTFPQKLLSSTADKSIVIEH